MKRIPLLASVLLLLFTGVSQAQITNLYTQSSSSDASLLLQGNVLYGMNIRGGNKLSGDIYSIHTDGTAYTVLYTFQDTGSKAFKCSGYDPYGNLTLVGNTFFGMTAYGGYNNEGTVFSIHTDGTHYRDLWDFEDTGSISGNWSGRNPYGSLIAIGHTLYGMTYEGGKYNDGEIFRIDTSYSKDSARKGFKDLWDFEWNAGSNGAYPEYTTLTPSASGKILYGMTNEGGVNRYGNVFVIDTDGTHYKDLYDFTCCNVAEDPYGSLLLNGPKLYAMTERGGVRGDGAIFAIDTSGKNFKELYDFNYNVSGAYPYGDLTLSGDKLYGMTSAGGDSGGHGVLFSVDTTGNNYENFFNFDDYTFGGEPFGSVVLSSGTLYGTTRVGGPTGVGTIFSYDVCGLLKVSSTVHADTGSNTGSITLSTGGGPTPYTYSWAPGGQTTANIAGLSIGTYTITVTDANGCKNVSTIHVGKGNTLGVNNISSNAGISVYPNPNNGNFTIALAGTSDRSVLEVYNMLGQQVFNHSLSLGNNTMSMNTQANGVYMYRILSDTGNLLEQGKLIIQK